MELKPQFENGGNGIETVTLTRAEFDWLVEQAEDAADLAAAYEGLKSLKDDGAIPAEVARAVRDGKHPIAAARAYRKMTQTDLAEAIGMTQPAIARLEASAPGTGRTETINSVTEVLALPRWLFEPRIEENPKEKLSRKIFNDNANPVTGRILRAAPDKNTGVGSSMVRESESGKFITERPGKTTRKRNEAKKSKRA
ncbi:helix-turn-helix transcriptional regulator [Parasphingorhabdus sp.]|uniref:helix-turn-helix domain-containing protein n=1 Tax=Parasphingorhabdus sp. TaxID=2709688 RepID=UPI003262FBE9